jgi:N-acetylmuramoyl-L-alanine amidase
MTKPPLDLSVEDPVLSTDGGALSETSDELASRRREALPSLLAFSALQSQVNHQETQALPALADSALGSSAATLQMLQDEVLDLVARRALGLTGADGIAIAMVEGEHIVCRASAGTIVPDAGARLDPNSGFSGACFRTGTIVRCDSVDKDDRVNRQACQQLGARSMLAVPLLGRYQTVGLIEAFSADEHAFNEADVRILTYLAEVILGALKQEENPVKAPLSEPPDSKPQASAAPKVELAKADAPLPVAKTASATAGANQLSAVLAETPAQRTPEAEPSLAVHPGEPASRPGLPVVVTVVLAACLLAGGLWWQMHAKTWAKKANSVAPAAMSAAANSTAADNSALFNSPLPADDAVLASELNDTVAKSGPLPEVTSIRHWTSGNVSNVVVDLQDQVPYEAHRLSGPDRIYFDLHDASLNTTLGGKAIAVGDPVLSRVRAAQLNAGVVRVVLDTTASSTFSVSLEHDPYRLLVQIRGGGAPATDKSRVSLFPATPEPSAAKLATLSATAEGDQARPQARLPKLKIVLDAGHGGWDLGTVGRKGLLEKDLVLDITQRLGKLLQNRLGSDVLYTRKDDFYISLDQRAASANSAQADLFVSIHANYSDMPSARGVETYYTQSFSAPGPQELDAKAPAGTPTPSAITLTSVQLKEKILESRRLAASVQQSMYSTLADQSAAIHNRGVKEASYAVLTGTEMPGILAEVSFVSSPADETNLQREEYRQRIAEALYRGIARYAATSSRTKMAKAGTSGASQ